MSSVDASILNMLSNQQRWTEQAQRNQTVLASRNNPSVDTIAGLRELAKQVQASQEIAQAFANAKSGLQAQVEGIPNVLFREHVRQDILVPAPNPDLQPVRQRLQQYAERAEKGGWFSLSTPLTEELSRAYETVRGLQAERDDFLAQATLVEATLKRLFQIQTDLELALGEKSNSAPRFERLSASTREHLRREAETISQYAQKVFADVEALIVTSHRNTESRKRRVHARYKEVSAQVRKMEALNRIASALGSGGDPAIRAFLQKVKALETSLETSCPEATSTYVPPTPTWGTGELGKREKLLTLAAAAVLLSSFQPVEKALEAVAIPDLETVRLPLETLSALYLLRYPIYKYSKPILDPLRDRIESLFESSAVQNGVRAVCIGSASVASYALGLAEQFAEGSTARRALSLLELPTSAAVHSVTLGSRFWSQLSSLGTLAVQAAQEGAAVTQARVIEAATPIIADTLAIAQQCAQFAVNVVTENPYLTALAAATTLCAAVAIKCPGLRQKAASIATATASAAATAVPNAVASGVARVAPALASAKEAASAAAQSAGALASRCVSSIAKHVSLETAIASVAFVVSAATTYAVAGKYLRM